MNPKPVNVADNVRYIRKTPCDDFLPLIISDIILASLCHVIDDVIVKPDVENTLESILKDLES